MNGIDRWRGTQLGALLAEIARAEAEARGHDSIPADREWRAEAAQRADEAAEAGRLQARMLIEDAFPGVSWAMIERAAL